MWIRAEGTMELPQIEKKAENRFTNIPDLDVVILRLLEQLEDEYLISVGVQGNTYTYIWLQEESEETKSCNGCNQHMSTFSQQRVPHYYDTDPVWFCSDCYRIYINTLGFKNMTLWEILLPNLTDENKKTLVICQNQF